MVSRTGLQRLIRSRVLPLAGRTKTGVVTRATDRRVLFIVRRMLIGFVVGAMPVSPTPEILPGSHLKTLPVCR